MSSQRATAPPRKTWKGLMVGSGDRVSWLAAPECFGLESLWLGYSVWGCWVFQWFGILRGCGLRVGSGRLEELPRRRGGWQG